MFLPKSPEMSDNLSHCSIHLDHHNSRQFCTFYSVLDEIGTKMITSNISALVLSLSCTRFHFQQRLLTYTHSLPHTAPTFAPSVSHTHGTKKSTNRPQSLSGNEKSISFYLFSLSIIQFHDLDHNVGNLDGVQIADKANFLVYFLFFQLL